MVAPLVIYLLFVAIADVIAYCEFPLSTVAAYCRCPIVAVYRLTEVCHMIFIFADDFLQSFAQFALSRQLLDMEQAL